MYPSVLIRDRWTSYQLTPQILHTVKDLNEMQLKRNPMSDCKSKSLNSAVCGGTSFQMRSMKLCFYFRWKCELKKRPLVEYEARKTQISRKHAALIKNPHILDDVCADTHVLFVSFICAPKMAFSCSTWFEAATQEGDSNLRKRRVKKKTVLVSFQLCREACYCTGWGLHISAFSF